MAQAQRNGGRNGVGYGPDARPVLLHEGQALPADGIQPQLYQLAADLQTEAPRHLRSLRLCRRLHMVRTVCFTSSGGPAGVRKKSSTVQSLATMGGRMPAPSGKQSVWAKAGNALRDRNSLPHKTGSDRPRLGKQVGIGRFLRPSKCRDGLLGRAGSCTTMLLRGKALRWSS